MSHTPDYNIFNSVDVYQLDTSHKIFEYLKPIECTLGSTRGKFIPASFIDLLTHKVDAIAVDDKTVIGWAYDNFLQVTRMIEPRKAPKCDDLMYATGLMPDSPNDTPTETIFTFNTFCPTLYKGIISTRCAYTHRLVEDGSFVQLIDDSEPNRVPVSVTLHHKEDRAILEAYWLGHGYDAIMSYQTYVKVFREANYLAARELHQSGVAGKYFVISNE